MRIFGIFVLSCDNDSDLIFDIIHAMGTIHILVLMCEHRTLHSMVY
jgi:hypothetical protein